MFKPIKGFSVFTIIVGRDGIVIEHRTPERVVGDSTYQHRVCVLDLDTLAPHPKRNKSTVAHHDLKNVDWDVYNKVLNNHYNLRLYYML